MGDFDLRAIGKQFGLGPLPFLIFTANGKSFDFTDVDGAQFAAESVDADDGFVAVDFDAFELGAAIRNLGSVVLGKGETDETVGDIAFVFGVNVVGFTEVDDDGLSGVGKLLGQGLRFAKFGPIAVARLCFFGLEVGELHPVKGEIALLGFFAPELDHEGKEVAVFLGATGVGFALIPDDAFDAVLDVGVEHAGVDVARTALAGELILGRARSLGNGFASFFGFFCGGFPFGMLHGMGGFDFFKVISGLGLFPAGHGVFEAWIGVEDIAAHPGFSGRTTPGVVDQADGDVEVLVKGATEEETDGGEGADIGRGAGFPLAFEVFLDFLGANEGHLDEADVGMFGGGDFEVGIP